MKDIASNSPSAREYSRIAAVVAWSSTLLACAALLLLSSARAAEASNAQTPLKASSGHQNVILPARTYAGDRDVTLTQIDESNVGTLGQAWRTAISDDGEQEGAPIVT